MSTTKIMLIFGGLALLVVGFTVYFMRSGNPVEGTNLSAGNASGNNVSMTDGKQIVEIKAKGGYQPQMSQAKAGVPTVLRFNTQGTFDCTATVRIPSLNISEALPSSGTTDIALGTLQPGTLQGTCGMGMYRFQVSVQN